eukprot:gnl/TRDRNA2_/TRDRNA2_179560_c0_seq1.p1 gnl/TRDRNA2_/TRDRNA2_179560_c0~~gnl/TRDRNA2_/TRDRNA2_179560_c0_seq1.p1  ORF type:complete len:198 (+),score=50.35 gnl/TRDRNA2_/TRDRNA2_179560_c0_seq1:84-677(+)
MAQFCDASAVTTAEARTERELLRRLAEAEFVARNALQQEKSAADIKRVELERQVAAAEEDLCNAKEAALQCQSEVALMRREGSRNAQSLAEVWPEVDSAAMGLKCTSDELSDTRLQSEMFEEQEAKEMALSRAVYQVYVAGTGIRWDLESENVEGYISLGNDIRRFELTTSEKSSAAATADALWEEIEASTPSDITL